MVSSKSTMTINARRARRHAAEDALSAPDGLLDLDAAKQEPRQLDQQEICPPNAGHG